VLGAAGLIKQLAGQINVVIHALGILLCLPHILRPGEVIEYVSLGAGNTGRAFDLETNLRVAGISSSFAGRAARNRSVKTRSLRRGELELLRAAPRFESKSESVMLQRLAGDYCEPNAWSRAFSDHPAR